MPLNTPLFTGSMLFNFKNSENTRYAVVKGNISPG